MSPFEKDSQFLKSNAAAMRALAGGKEHQVTYAGNDTHVGNEDVRLPAQCDPCVRIEGRERP